MRSVIAPVREKSSLEPTLKKENGEKHRAENRPLLRPKPMSFRRNFILEEEQTETGEGIFHST